MEDIILILRGFRERYELYYGVRIFDNVFVEVVMFFDRYISGRFLFDKGNMYYFSICDYNVYSDRYVEF